MDKTTYMTDSDRPQGVPNLTPAERREFLQQLEKFEPPQSMEEALTRHRDALKD